MRTLRAASLRRYMGVVPQDTVLFNDTLRSAPPRPNPSRAGHRLPFRPSPLSKKNATGALFVHPPSPTGLQGRGGGMKGSEGVLNLLRPNFFGMVT